MLSFFLIYLVEYACSLVKEFLLSSDALSFTCKGSYQML